MDECMLNDLLECSVCLERLDTSSKVLPCQHTFCKKCLEEILSTHRELRCPECRVLVDVKIDELPPNVLLMRILEGMRNAIPRSIKTPVRGISAPQRLLGGHQIAPVLSTANQIPLADVNPELIRQTNSAAKQVHLHNQPYGRAIYDYISKVPGDLSFKKGDIVILRKKIDNNWYFGECGNSHGVFPLSYVQVMTPLPPHVPQCKALYDFRMTNDDEDGCLTFNKGEVISVIRRVDENWAEGKLLDRIGIFPLAFVELNSVARALMKLSTNAQPGPSRVAPPTPTNEETTPLIPTDHSRNVQAASQPRPQIPLASTLPMSDSSSIVSSGGSSTTTTPNTPNSSNTSSSSSTAPSSPSSPAATSPPAVGSRHSMKRHSFTAINSGHHPHTHHRHSAEILSPAIDAALTGAAESFSPVQTSTSTDPGVRHRRSGSSDLVLSQPSQNMLGNTAGTHLPAAYIALYPYKPQKADELELRKGGIYMVTERCQDGWFKGTSNRTQKCGVFPGNYVARAKSQLQIRNICRTATSAAATTTTTTHQGNQSPSLSTSSNEPRPCITYTKNKGAAPQPQGLRALPPPELPPRTASPASGISSSWHGQGDNQNQTQSQTSKQSLTANPLGRSHSAVMSTNLASPGKQNMLPPQLTDLNRSPNNTLRLANSVNTPPQNTSVAAGTAKSTEKKEKKDKGVSLMRRLTNIKKSKSPPPASYSMDNPVFDDGNTVTVVNPIHVRSGSCPSQLLQVCPQLDVNNQNQNQNQNQNTHHRLYTGTGSSGSSHATTTSQRLKHKERPSLPVSFLQRTGDNGVSNAAMGSHHRKSNSLDAGTGKHSKQQSSGRERDREHRFRCIAPYPPNSEFELELRVGDIIYVHKKREDGWYKGTLQRTGRTGLFPASFAEGF